MQLKDPGANVVIVSLNWLPSLIDRHGEDLRINSYIEILMDCPYWIEENNNFKLLDHIEFTEELTELLKEIRTRLNFTLMSYGIDYRNLIFNRWLDHKTIVLINAKLIYDWM